MSRGPGFMEEKKKVMAEEFRRLSPLERMKRMNRIFNDMIALKAKNEGVPEYEIYRRYIETGR